MKILVACEFSGKVRDAFTKKGHYAMSCDLLPSETEGPHYQGDVRDILDKGWDMMIGHPPCTRLCNSGVRWLHKPPSGKTLENMWADLEEATDFFNTLWKADIPKICLENPVMHLHAKGRIKDWVEPQIVQPWWFGEEAFKATGLYLKNLPRLVPTNKLVPPKKKENPREHARWSAIHRAAPSKDRWKIRSMTYQAIANAMADQWG